MKYLFLFIIPFFFLACGTTNQNLAENFSIQNKISGIVPHDLKKFPQDAKAYVKNTPQLSTKKQQKLFKNFKKVYFKPWHMKSMQITKKQSQWGYAYKNMHMFGENYQTIKHEWFKKVIENSNTKAFDTIQKKAITICNSHLKVFPSLKPMFKDYTKAGEGFPFDYNQNTSIKINAPLYVSHYSKDKAWAYVSSSSASGWIRIKDIAFVDDTLANKFQSNKLYVATEDNTPIYKNKIFRDYVNIGTIFPLRKNKLMTIIRDTKGKGYLSYISSNKNIIPLPLKFSQKNITKILNAMIDKPYGWGGLYNNRDCSLLTKDFLTPFGFALQRNSFAQTKNGSYISVKNKSNSEKLRLLKEKGIPFLTLIYIKGHISLYLGIYDNTPVMFHSTWGIKTRHEDENGRIIIGRSVISSLEMGKEFEIYDPKSNYLAKMQGIVLLQ